MCFLVFYECFPCFVMSGFLVCFFFVFIVAQLCAPQLYMNQLMIQWWISDDHIHIYIYIYIHAYNIKFWWWWMMITTNHPGYRRPADGHWGFVLGLSWEDVTATIKVWGYLGQSRVARVDGHRHATWATILRVGWYILRMIRKKVQCYRSPETIIAHNRSSARARDSQDWQHELFMLHILGIARVTSSGIKSGSSICRVLATILALYGKPETNASHTAMVSINVRFISSNK